jgi:hypothetical protein
MRFDPEELGVQAPPAMSFLSGGGQMGAIMRAHDWSLSPLGSPAHWPQSLRSVVGLLLNSQFPMFVAWGSDLGFLYNDAYAPGPRRQAPAGARRALLRHLVGDLARHLAADRRRNGWRSEFS